MSRDADRNPFIFRQFFKTGKPCSEAEDTYRG